MILLAIDPGARTGWCTYSNKSLTACGSHAPDEFPLVKCDRVVIENPEIRPHSPARPKDILTLARIVGRYQERYRGTPIKLVLPHEWKGSIDKEIMLNRIRSKLTDFERAMVAAARTTDDTIDAIGLAKWALSAYPTFC